MSNSSQLKAQVSIWEEEDPDVFAILSPLDRGARSRAIRQMLRSAALINKGVYIIAGSQIAVAGARPHSEIISIKATSSKAPSESTTVLPPETVRRSLPSAPQSGFPTPKMSSIS